MTASSTVVLHVRVVTGAGGGPEKTILNTPRFYRGTGYTSACAYLHPPGDPGFEVLETRARQTGAELISIPDRGLTDLSVVKRLVAVCKERDVRIWHGHDYKSDALGLLVSRFHPMKLVTTVHGWVDHTSRAQLYRRVDLKCLRHYERVVCVSETLLAECLAAGVPVEKLSLIENGIVLDDYGSVRRDLRSRNREISDAVTPAPKSDDFGYEPMSCFNSDIPIVGAVGRLSEEKGFDVLIRAFDQLLATGTQAKLVIAGEGGLQSELQQLIRDLKREDSITLLGHVPDARLVFNALDVFVLSSRREGLPNVLLEAMACRVPTIATPVGGVPNVVTHEHDALLVPVDDVDALTVSLTRLLNNGSLQQQLADNAYRTVADRFSFELRMQKFVALYDELLQQESKQPLFSLDCGDSSPLCSAAAFDSGDDFSSHFNADRDGGLDSSTTPFPAFEAGGVAAQVSAESPHSTTMVAERPQLALKPVALGQVKVELTSTPEAWGEYLASKGHAGFYQRAAWLRVLQEGLQHEPACLQATVGRRLVGVLPLAYVKSPLFGKFLVSLPYVNSSGIVADSVEAELALADRAIGLADQLDVRYLELRHERPVEHPQLKQAVTDKVHMRLKLPTTPDGLWDGIKSKVRNQIRKPQKNEALTVHWGTHDILDEFYDVFCKNMRDLGTPPFSRKLFAALIDHFPGAAEFCCVRLSGEPVASGLLIHGRGTTEVPSASSLRAFNSTNCNMLLYWNLLTRAVERGQSTFDFGRSSRDSGTYAFKSQWGATESPAVWQHYVREGDARDMRPNNGKFDLMIRAWQKLPVWVTKLIGPGIVRGIP